jgi:hypothetical protein
VCGYNKRNGVRTSAHPTLPGSAKRVGYSSENASRVSAGVG